MGNRYLTVKEFAAAANVSSQAIYKRLKQVDNPLQTFVKLVDNQKMIDSKALYELYGIQENSTSYQPVEQPNQPGLQPQNEQLTKDIIDILQKELEEKNKLIDNLMNRLEEQNNLLDQEQKLRLIDHNRLLELEKQQASQEQEEATKKKHWWNSILKHD